MSPVPRFHLFKRCMVLLRAKPAKLLFPLRSLRLCVNFFLARRNRVHKDAGQQPAAQKLLPPVLNDSVRIHALSKF